MAGASRQGERAERAVMTSSSVLIASPAPDIIVKLRGPTPKNVKMRGPTPKLGDPLQVAGASRDRPSAGRLTPQIWGKCPQRTANGEWRMVKMPATLHLPTRHLPFATRRIPPAHSQAPRSRLGPRLAPAPGCRPPERMPPPMAGASRQGERAERAGMTSSSVLIASLPPDLGRLSG